uniref:Uncharacterized protein n=1 Tax=Dolomedes sulfureus TaxID=492288 RepID=A0A0P0D153_9ARAC|nr:hypothetical protein [Dolomedes sulfureus]
MGEQFDREIRRLLASCVRKPHLAVGRCTNPTTELQNTSWIARANARPTLSAYSRTTIFPSQPMFIAAQRRANRPPISSPYSQSSGAITILMS